METGPRLKVSSDRLVKPGIEPATRGLQGNRFIHYTKGAPSLYGEQYQCYQHVTDKKHHKEHLCESILNWDLWSVRRRSMLFKEKAYDGSQ